MNDEKQSRNVSRSNLENYQKDNSIRKEMLMTKTKKIVGSQIKDLGLENTFLLCSFTNLWKMVLFKWKSSL